MEGKFSEFRESDKSDKHEKILSVTCLTLAMW